MDYKKKYEEAKGWVKSIYPELSHERQMEAEAFFPELAESKVEENQMGGIVLEDFNEGDGFYKVNLAYLSKEQVEEIENIVKKWT